MQPRVVEHDTIMMEQATKTKEPRRRRSRPFHRQSECLRKRKYRASKRGERKLLEAELRYYEDQLEGQMLAHHSHTSWEAKAIASFQQRLAAYRHHNTLESTVQQQIQLVQALQAWVSAQQQQQPPKSILQSTIHATSPPWLHATLVADPVARQYGYEWLSERVFNSAMSARDGRYPFGGSVVDTATLRMHTCDDDNDGRRTISAMETHSQHTILHNFHAVAAVVRAEMLQIGRTINISSEVVDVASAGYIIYEHSVHQRLGTSLRNVIRFFYPAQNCVVITYCSVLEDECHPLQDGELRPHGFAWMILERVTDSITLLRDSRLQYSPVTTQGPISLADHGRIFGQVTTEEAIASDGYLDKIQAAAEANYVAMQEGMVRGICRRLDRTSLDCDADSVLM
ncbi:Aste57867_12916 [Aphanomyces stellatus]|uniref:Aste57867_12916 protein n=1 Tax=Aphanomyces stellatus TaxID=120398 RepID=A0A485KWU9_9STRA|nr:hypothetical protein As57867_012868 [Aphanomyces stellatus]VFT89762.1 Aste57867_12916 [Aphanomyces stellatus]